MGERASWSDGHAPAPGLTLERFSEVVGSIYECALQPELWPDVLAEICKAVGGPSGWVAVHELSKVQSRYEVEFGTDPEWQQRLREHYVAVSPFIGIAHHVRPGEVWSFGDAIDYDEFLGSRFYREWSQPQGLSDTIMGVMTKTPERLTWLGVCLDVRATEAHKARVGCFVPHVERSLRISRLLEFRAAQTAELVAAVESLATGLIVVDSEFQVRGINPAAERLIRETGALRVERGCLREAAGGSKLAEGMSACVGARLDRAGASMLYPSRDGGVGLLVQMVPLPTQRTRRPSDAAAAIFLSAPSQPKAAPMEVFVQHYGLTPSETRVLLATLNGQNPRAIAEANGLAMPTVRTHLSRLYGKTQTSGRTELVRLISSMSVQSG